MLTEWAQYKMASDAFHRALLALSFAERKTDREVAWEWAYRAADNAVLVGIQNARPLLRYASYPDTHALRRALENLVGFK